LIWGKFTADKPNSRDVDEVTYLLLVDDGLEKQSFIGVHF